MPVFTRHQILRKQGWFLHDRSVPGLGNIVRAGLCFFRGSKILTAWPIALKIDITPLCNLHCVSCIHALPHGNPDLLKQRFEKHQKMSVTQFAALVAQVKGKTSAVSLYYYGDPYCHPDVDEMCGIARRTGLNVHLSTNFSFHFSDRRIEAIAESGVTHIAVCVDGIRQETYGRTRVGGDVDLVLSNLRRLAEARRRKSSRTPEIEVQYLLYQHNREEWKEARVLFREIGVDRVTAFWGALHNCTDVDLGKYPVLGPRPRSMLPRCFWPFFFMVIKYNGDVVPCCEYRVGTQYAAGGKPRVLGNVFDSGVWEVWNGPRYRQARLLASDPRRVLVNPDLREHFCDGCNALFHDDKDHLVKMARDYRFEDVYEVVDGRVVPLHRHGKQRDEVVLMSPVSVPPPNST